MFQIFFLIFKIFVFQENFQGKTLILSFIMIKNGQTYFKNRNIFKVCSLTIVMRIRLKHFTLKVIYEIFWTKLAHQGIMLIFKYRHVIFEIISNESCTYQALFSCKVLVKTFNGESSLNLLMILIHFRSLFHLYTSWKHQKTSDFLMFSRGIVVEVFFKLANFDVSIQWQISSKLMPTWKEVNVRSSHRGVFKSSPNFTGKHFCWNLFIIKWQILKAWNLIKKEIPTQVFFCEICKFFKSTCFEQP